MDGKVSTVKLPRIMGHELAGEVVQIGRGVDGWGVGDHGMVQTTISCGNCYHCRVGRENNCSQRVGRFGFEIDCGFGEYVRVPARNLCKIARDIPLEQACIISGTTAMPLHAIRTQGQLHMGETVVIIGIGGWGSRRFS